MVPSNKGYIQISTDSNLRKVIPVNQHGLKCSFKLYSKDVKDLQSLSYSPVD